MKTRTLQEIQNEVAKEHRYGDWTQIVYVGDTNRYWPEVCRRAQLEACRETLKNAEVRVVMDHEWANDETNHVRASITSESNIVIIE